MHTYEHGSATGCCLLRMGRRDFLTAAGGSALALKIGVLDFASSLFAGEARPARKPRVRAVFVRPEEDRYWMAWPGAAYDPKARQAEYTQVLADAAKQYGVQLEVNPVPFSDADSVDEFLTQLEQSPPDGVIVTAMHLKCWPQVNYIVKHHGDVPTIVFSPLGTSFTESYQAIRDVPKTFVAATQDPGWLASGVRMFKTMRELNRCRLCMVTDAATGDQVLEPIGTTLHYIPLERWPEEFNRAELTDEMREIAKYCAIEAKDIVEPEKEDLFNAVKNYVVAQRLMAAEHCDGISVDCARLIDERRTPCGPCLAWSRLLDEGRVAACEADWRAGISMLLVGQLFGRPGFMQDPVPNTVNHTLIGSHCTCATKLDGYDKPSGPFILRSHAESNTGVAIQVLWREGQELTILKFQDPGSIAVGTGRVVRNIDSSAQGGCRTSVEITVDDVADPRDIKGHHQLFVYGRLDAPLKAYCQLAGIKVLHI
jgi:hypothetical protein